MSPFLRVVRRDFEHVRGNVIAFVVCAGLAVLPSLYAWFNIAGSWDPYGNTGQVKVALANSDEGYSSTLIPFRICIGERVVSSLAGSEKIDYVVTSEDEAIEGVRSGEYYAAIVIPARFTADMMTALSSDARHPQLIYYTNEKRNAIASIVTGKASGSVRELVDESFAESVTEIGAGVLEDLSALLDDDGLASLQTTLDAALAEGSQALRRAAQDVAGYNAVVGSARSVLDTDPGLGSQGSLNASALLRSCADGTRELDEAVSTATSAVDDALASAASSIATAQSAIDDAFASADADLDSLVAALDKAEGLIADRRDALQQVYDLLETLSSDEGALSELVAQLELELRNGTIVGVDIKGARQVQLELSDAKARLAVALGYLDDLAQALEDTKEDLQTTRTNAVTSQEELNSLIASAQAELGGVQTDFESSLHGSLTRLSSTADSAADDAASVSAALHDTVDELRPLMTGSAEGLEELEASLANAQQQLEDAADRLDDLRERLADATDSDGMELIRTIIGDNPTALAEFVAAPVEVNRIALYAIENNGSAMAPYYTTMSLWVGGTLMGVLFYVGLSEEARRQTGAKPRHAYFGRLVFFLAIGAMQATIVTLGDLFFLGIQCAHPLLFMLAGWVASTVFINIIYSLSTSFGDVGKAIAVLLMVVQVAGSGGTFPVEMLPAPFQAIYPYLPFVHSENAMRSAICGVYGNDYLVSLAKLASFLVPALLLGLVLRKPLVRLNEWFEEKLEETELM